MTQLLISVKNVEESLVARYAGVDVIDLKDPAVGALGALDTNVVRQVIEKVERSALISATVGEGHQSVEALVSDICSYANLGVDVVKVSVSDLFLQTHFFAEMQRLSAQGIKLVVVFFADKTLDFSLLAALQKNGFYGAMLDTQAKQLSLLEVQPVEVLSRFVELCKKHQLISGLAGSINKVHVNALLDIAPTFIGLRGGVCDGLNRMSALSEQKLTEVKELLFNYNSSNISKGQADGFRTFDLHI